MIDFICVGAQKSGTTTLHDVLSTHPEIYLPKVKETHFFDKIELYQKGLHWYYDSFFKNCQGKCVGEITPDYLYVEGSIERIKRDLGSQLKIIVIFRDPVMRAYSHYGMSKSRGFEQLDFLDAIKAEEGRLKNGSYFNKIHFSYIDRGRYLFQFKRLQEQFSDSQILPLVFETQMKANFESTIFEIQSFLGVNQRKLRLNVQSNVTQETRSGAVSRQIMNPTGLISAVSRRIPLSDQRKYQLKTSLNSLLMRKPTRSLEKEVSRDLFNRYYAEERLELEKLTGLDLSHWKK